MKINPKIIGLYGFLFLSFTLFAQENTKKKEIDIRIAETSDVHGCVFPYDLVYQKKRKGSLAQVESYVKAQRSDTSRIFILLDNGDILQGTPFVYYYNYANKSGQHALAAVMNYMKYDAGTVGNHDIEPGHAVYDSFKKQINFPWLAANAVSDSSGEPYFKPYTIIERQGIKIAVLGLITPAIPNWLPHSIWSGMHFDDMVTTARYWSKYIRAHEHPDLLIGLFHSGTHLSEGINEKGEPAEDASGQVAAEVPGFDVIFAGHDHRRFTGEITNAEGKKVVLLDPAAHAETVAQADIRLIYDTLTGCYRKSVTGRLVSMKDYKPDTQFITTFKPALKPVRQFVNRRIGTFLSGMDAREALFGPSAFMDFVHQLQLEETGADISLVSLLSLKAQIPKGDVYMRDLFKLYRFENYLYTLSLKGFEIKNALEYSYSRWLNTPTRKNRHMILFKLDSAGNIVRSSFTGKAALKYPYFNFVSAAGIIYTVDIRKKAGERIKIISMADGTPFDPEKTYKVAVNSYQGNGGGGMLTKGAGLTKQELSGRLLKSSDKDIRYLMMLWIEKRKTVNPRPLNNWKIIPERKVKQLKKTDYRLLFGE